MNEIIRMSLLRHDDITMLRHLLRSLYSKNEQSNAAEGSGQVFGGLMSERTRSIVARVHANEAHRQN